MSPTVAITLGATLAASGPVLCLLGRLALRTANGLLREAHEAYAAADGKLKAAVEAHERARCVRAEIDRNVKIFDALVLGAASAEFGAALRARAIGERMRADAN